MSKRRGLKQLSGCTVALLLLSACGGLGHKQSQILPVDTVNVGRGGVVEMGRSDNGERFRLCGVVVPKGFEAPAQSRLEELLRTPDVDVVLQGVHGNTYEAFLVGVDGETSIEEDLLLDGLLVTGKDVERCLNGGPRVLAQSIAQNNKTGVWGVVVSRPVSPEKP